MKDMGELVRIRRESAGYSAQKHLADKIGKGQSWLSRLESGTMKEIPTPEDLTLLGDALGVTQAELLAAAGYDVETGHEDEHPAITALRAIIGDRQFTEKELRHLTNAVRIMIQMQEGS